MVSDNILKLTIKGSGFLIGNTFLTRTLFVVRSIVLARLLNPHDFGLISISLVLISGLRSLTAIGVEKYLIQRPELNIKIIGNAWSLNIFRGALLSFLALMLCPLYSNFVHEPKSLEVLKIVAFIPLFEGFINPGIILAERKINFAKISIYELIFCLLEVAFVILLALIVRDVRALSYGFLFGAAVKTILSFIFFEIPTTPKINIPEQIELLSVAKHFITISVGSLIMINGDNFIIGSMLGVTELGFYVIAYQLAAFPVQMLRLIASRVAFPVISNLQIEKDNIKTAAQRILQINLFIIIPCVICLVFFAEELILTLYGEKWLKSVNILRILSIVTLGRGMTHIAIPYILGTGNFKFESKMKIFETIIFLIGIYIGCIYLGLIGVAIGAGAGYLVAGSARFIFIGIKSNIALKTFFQLFILPLISVIPGAIFAHLATKMIKLPHTFLMLIIFFIVCICYILMSLLVQKSMVKNFIKSKQIMSG
jgi:O-antigen/teichoic acid export membrane protein